MVILFFIIKASSSSKYSFRQSFDNITFLIFYFLFRQKPNNNIIYIFFSNFLH